MHWINKIIDRTTMYRLLLYILVILLLLAIIFSWVGVLSYKPIDILMSIAVTLTVGLITNFVFSWVLKAPTNTLSTVITALIVSLLITPPSSFEQIPFIIATVALAIASKYLLTWHNKPIFNPVAIAIVLTAFGPEESASWWVGNLYLMPFVIIGGFLITMKIRRFSMVGVFLATAILGTIVSVCILGKDINITLQTLVLHSSLFFLAGVMLTEPQTSPSTAKLRLIYGGIVGLLFIPDVHIGNIYSTPELALCIGNLFSFIVSPKFKTLVTITGRRMYGNATESIAFIPKIPFNYKAGQYVEVTLPHNPQDKRDMRRYLTLASSPTENELLFGIRYYSPSSSFKQKLRAINNDAFMSVGTLGGNFTLPKATTRKLAFIAGGIGITPFRSMTKFLSDTDDKRLVTLFYGERSNEDIAYSEIFEEARRKVNVNTLYVIDGATASDHVRSGKIDSQLIKAELPDYLEYLFYISGPQPMVQSIHKELVNMGVSRFNIRTDYFSGYA